MRFLLIVLIWVVFVGGLKLYIWQRDAQTRIAAPQPVTAEKLKGDWALELTPTFSAVEDPFALQSDQVDEAPIDLRLNGDSVAIGEVEMERGRPLLIDEGVALQRGHNEIFVRASPPLGDGGTSHGIRVRVLDGRAVLADETIWGDGGLLVSGSVSFQLHGNEEERDDH